MAAAMACVPYFRLILNMYLFLTLFLYLKQIITTYSYFCAIFYYLALYKFDIRGAF